MEAKGPLDAAIGRKRAAHPHSPIKSVVFLGTSAAKPTRTRSVTSHALLFQDGGSFLLDCGEGTQHRIAQCSQMKLSRIRAVLITHLHGDHCFGLPGLLASGIESLRVVGPRGLRELIDTALRLSDTFITYDLQVTELKDGEAVDLGTTVDGCHQVSAHPLVHKVACFGYVVSDPAKEPKLDFAKATSLGARGRQLGELKSGKDVVLIDGTVVRAADVLGPVAPGVRVVLLGDTSDSSSIVEAGRGCDMLVHECTFDASCEEKQHMQALLGGHSTSRMAGAFAAEIGARQLVLTHFSQRYTSGMGEGTGERTGEREERGREGSCGVQDLVEEATKLCPGCSVAAAEDLQEFLV